jgi:flagellar export protein FliJ
MKKFEFKLGTVHKVREIRKEREAIILGELETEAVKAAQKVSNIDTLRQEAIENYARRLSAGEQLDAAEMELNSSHVNSLNRRQKDAEADLQQKRSSYLRQVEFVTEAMRDVKITERLRETQKERHGQEMSRQEQNSIDEHVSGTFARRIIEAK